MSDFEIRSGVPMPGRTGREGKNFPLAALIVGQCILVEKKSKKSLQNAMAKFMIANPGWQFKGRTLEAQYGVWCVARPDSAATPVAPEANSTPPDQAAPMAERLRNAAKLQPPGKRAAHVLR